MTRNRLLITSALAALAVGVIATPVLAGGRGNPDYRGGPEAMFERLDTNDDGSISREEFDAGRPNRLGEADTDGDGKVSLEEFKVQAEGRRNERITSMFERLDSDGDGFVTVEERDTHHTRMFEFLDRDGDGVISADEVPERGKRNARRGPGAEPAK